MISNSEVLNLAERITLKTIGMGLSNDGDFNEVSIVLTPFQMRLGHTIQLILLNLIILLHPSAPWSHDTKTRKWIEKKIKLSNIRSFNFSNIQKKTHSCWCYFTHAGENIRFWTFSITGQRTTHSIITINTKYIFNKENEKSLLPIRFGVVIIMPCAVYVRVLVNIILLFLLLLLSFRPSIITNVNLFNFLFRPNLIPPFNFHQSTSARYRMPFSWEITERTQKRQ